MFTVGRVRGVSFSIGGVGAVLTIGCVGGACSPSSMKIVDGGGSLPAVVVYRV